VRPPRNPCLIRRRTAGLGREKGTFLTHRKAEPLVGALGRTGARVVYVLLGLALVAGSAFFFYWAWREAH